MERWYYDSDGVPTPNYDEPPHCHPCEVCGIPVDCEDCCDGDQQTIVYCTQHAAGDSSGEKG